MEKFYIIKNNKEIVGAREFINNLKSEEVSCGFIRREAFPEENPLESSSQKPAYIDYVNRMGFHWEENADKGHVQYGYKGQFIMELVKEYAQKLVHEIGFPIYEVSGANMFDASHPVVNAYADLYGDRLYRIPSKENSLVMSYDGSYPQFNLAQKMNISEKHLPFAHFSFADCYRQEQSGECMLLFRQRRFYMPDLHPYFKDAAEAFEWIPKLEEKILEAGKAASYDYHVVIEVSSQKYWEQYKEKIVSFAAGQDRDVLVNVLDDGKDRYWIINVDYKLMDKLGQSREIACIQIDVGNAKRLEIDYRDESGNMKNPVIVHSAIPGGAERYLYMMFDDFKNRFPLWLSPVHIRLVPVSEKYVELCESYRSAFALRNVRIEIDDRSVPVGKRIKMGHEDLVPYIIVIGEKERESSVELDNAVKVVEESGKNMPFKQISWPHLLDRRI